MTCLECRDLMLEVARHRAAPFVDRRVLAHVADCERLRAASRAGAGVDRGARRGWRRDAGAAAASPDVEQRLMAAFAAQAGTRRPARTPPGASGLAGCRRRQRLLLAAGGAAWWGLRPARVAPPASPVAQASPAGIPWRRRQRRSRPWPRLSDQRNHGAVDRAKAAPDARRGPRGATGAPGRSGRLRADPVGGWPCRRSRAARSCGSASRSRRCPTTASTFQPARRRRWRRIFSLGRTGRRGRSVS